MEKQSILTLPTEDRNRMWGYYQGTEHFYQGETEQGWKFYLEIVRTHPWTEGSSGIGSVKKLPPFTIIESIVIESPDEVKFSFTSWKRQNEEVARAFPHILDIEATDFDIVARVNKWLDEKADYEDLWYMPEDYFDNYYQECPVSK